MEARATFPPRLDSPRAARQWAATWCAAAGGGDQVDSLMLVISELVTHALHHGEGEIEVRLERRGDRILGSVHDAAATPFTVEDRVDGGSSWVLQLLAELTDSWDVGEAGTEGGVHFEVVSPMTQRDRVTWN